MGIEYIDFLDIVGLIWETEEGRTNQASVDHFKAL
jgi:hypothetical protein